MRGTPFRSCSRHKISADTRRIDNTRICRTYSICALHLSSAYPQSAADNACLTFDRRGSSTNVAASRSPRVLVARHRMGRTGCGVPRIALHAIPGRLRKPALRHYERTRGARRAFDGASRRTFARDRMPQTPRWSAERRASYVTGREAPRESAFARVFNALCACGLASLARERVPLHPSACRRSAPSRSARRETSNLGGANASRAR